MASRNVLVRLVTDATGAKAGLKETTQELKKFGSYTAEATVKLQTEGVQAKLDKLNAQLKRYGEQPHTADVKIRMGNVARQIELTELQLRHLTEKPHEVKVRVNERSFLRVRERIGKLSFGNTVGRAGGAAFAAAGLGVGVGEVLKSVTEAYNTEQGAQARLRTQLGALNISYAENSKRIEEVIQHTSELSGLTGHDLNDAFTNIVRSTGNVSQSLHLVGLAADIARAKNLDVAKAGQLVGKVAAGSTSALSRYGIVIQKGATATEALGVLQKRFGGQAQAYGKTQQGALDKVNVAFEHLREVIGKRLAPFITRAANAVAKFVTQMAKGTGAGGRFVRQLRDIAKRIGSIIGFLLRHKTAIAVAIGAWAAYRLAAVAALAVTRLRLIGMFLGLAGPAAEGGTASGTAFGSRFGAAAGSLIRSFGWAAIGLFIADQINNAVNDRLNGGSNHPLSGNVSPVDRVRNPGAAAANAILHGRSPLDPTGGGNSTGHPSYTNLEVDGTNGGQFVQVRNNVVTAVSGRGPARVGDRVDVGDSGNGMRAYPAGTAGWGGRVTIHDRRPSHRPAGGDPRGIFSGGRKERRGPRTAKQILAGLGSTKQVTTRNLNLGVDQAERAYVDAVRTHGANSSEAIQAAADVESARKSLHDFEHPDTSAARRAAAARRRARRRRRQQAAAANPDATPQDIATEHAAQHYADVVAKYGANSPQAKRARAEGNVSTARGTIQTITARIAADIRKYGAGSQRVARDQTALARARTRLITATEQLTKAVKKGTDQNAALLPRLTDVAYHPISGRMQHTPTRHGLGVAGSGHHQTIHNNITTPGGIQYPDAEAFAAALQRKLAAKGNG